MRKNPGLTIVVVMPNGATSACSDSIQPSRPNFDAVAVRARGHNRVAGRQGGLGEIDAHATAGSGHKPNLFVTHDTSMPGRTLVCASRASRLSLSLLRT